MPTVGEMDAQDFARMNAETLKSVLGGRADGGSGSSSGGGSSNILGETINGAVNATAKFSTGQYAAADAVNNASTILGKLPGVGSVVSNAFDKLGNTAGTMNAALNEAGQAGGGFGNRLGDAAETVLGARMTFQEYTETIRKNSTSLTAFGGNVSDSAKTLLQLDKQVQETGIARVLIEAGVSQKEINDATLVYYKNAIGINRLDEKGKREAAESAARFSEELDKNARLYGKQRDQAMKEIQQQQEKANVQATLMQMDLKSRQNFSDMQAAVNPLGPKFRDMASEIAVYGQVRSESSRMIFSALGQAGIDYQNAVKAQMEARKPEDKARAAQQMEEAKAAIAKRQEEKDYLNVIRFNTGKFGTELGESLTGNAEFMSRSAAIEQAAEEVRQGKIKAGDDAVFAARVKQIQEEKAARSKQDKEGTDKDGKKNADALVGRTLNDLGGTLKDFSAGFGKTLNKTSNEVGTEIKNAGSTLAKAISTALHPRTAEEANNVFDINKIIPGGASQAARGTYDTSKDVKGKSHAIGTLGNFGEFFHDYGKEGFPATLHGEEMVLPKNQLPQFMQQFTSQMKDKIPNPQDLMKQMQGGMQVPSEVSDMVKSTAKASQNMSAPAASGGNVTLDHLHDDLQRLNKTMELMVAHTETMKDNSGRQVKATKAMAGNKLA
jgi:hypothetical protein